jgi:hypothetical protein
LWLNHQGVKVRSIKLTELGYTFSTKPLLIGGMAMEFYGLRPAGRDIDFVITRQDYEGLAALYPDHLRDLFGDLGVCVGEFEIWISICLFDYNYLSLNALERADYKIISLEKLLFLKAMGMQVPKYEADLRLIVQKILDIQYGKDTQPE